MSKMGFSAPHSYPSSSASSQDIIVGAIIGIIFPRPTSFILRKALLPAWLRAAAETFESGDDTTSGLRYKALDVSRLLRLLLVLIASSLVMMATTHAREFPAETVIDCRGQIHVEGDADRSSGDADKGIPHHHGTCHASAMDVPASDGLFAYVRDAGQSTRLSVDLAPPSRRVAPDLRPPNA